MNDFENWIYKKYGTKELNQREIEESIQEALDRKLIKNKDIALLNASTATDLVKKIWKIRKDEYSKTLLEDDANNEGFNRSSDEDYNVNNVFVKENNTSNNEINQLKNIKEVYFEDFTAKSFNNSNNHSYGNYTHSNDDSNNNSSKKLEKVIQAFIEYEKSRKNLFKAPKKFNFLKFFKILISVMIVGFLMFNIYTCEPY